jgi:hypothetical protein
MATRPFTLSTVISEYRGDWSSLNQYYAADIIRGADMFIYLCIRKNKNQEPPDESYWRPIANVGGGGAGLPYKYIEAVVSFADDDLNFRAIAYNDLDTPSLSTIIDGDYILTMPSDQFTEGKTFFPLAVDYNETAPQKIICYDNGSPPGMFTLEMYRVDAQTISLRVRNSNGDLTYAHITAKVEVRVYQT